MLTDDDRELLAAIIATCEASDLERHFLWRLYSREGRALNGQQPLPSIRSWSVDLRGMFFQIGQLDGRPVTICLNFATINGRRYMFWHCPSQVVDYTMAESWIKANVPNAKHWQDAGSFHIMVDSHSKRTSADPLSETHITPIL